MEWHAADGSVISQADWIAQTEGGAPADAETTETGAVDAETAETTETTEPADAETTDAETTDAETADAEPADAPEPPAADAEPEAVASAEGEDDTAG
jgi:hypothetical protein